MKKYILILLVNFIAMASFAQNPIRIPGKKNGTTSTSSPVRNINNPAYGHDIDDKGKNTFNAWISKDDVLHFTCTDNVTSAKLQTFTPEQLAIRKGTDNLYPYNSPVHEYSFKLTAPVYKGFTAYWLYVYTDKGDVFEAYFKRK